MWITWTHNDVKYLAIQNRDEHWLLIDADMNLYGTFRELPKRSDIGTRYQPIGRLVSLVPYVLA